MTDRKDCSGPFDPDVRYEDLSEEALVRPVREFALIVHLLDRSMCAATSTTAATAAATFAFPALRDGTSHIPVGQEAS